MEIHQPPRDLSVHANRTTPRGIQYLKQTGQFSEYTRLRTEAHVRPFIAWDGEGWTNQWFEHSYMLLQSSTGDHIHNPRLGSVEQLQLILTVGADNPRAIHIIFGGGYDATHILRDMPDELRAGLTNNNQVVWRVERTETTPRNRFVINYLPHKWLEIQGFNWPTRSWVRIKIFDLFSFFGSSFIEALDSRRIAVPEIIRSGKANRADFDYADLEEIRLYCQMELELLVQLADTLREEIHEADITINSWHGPATIAKALMRKHHVSRHMGDPPKPHLERAFQNAFIAGRFEPFQVGHYDGPVYVRDINSAYPHILRSLPSLSGGHWRRTTVFEPSLYGVWKCSYTSDGGPTIPNPTPWRGPSGEVGFPTHNPEIWLWTPEAKYATEIEYGYVFEPATDTKPFAYLEELYELRREWKSQGRGAEKTLKLGPNSTYGVTAQRVGGDPDKNGGRPTWHKLEWAGYITSATRAMLWEAISQDPEAIIAVETDSVTSTRPLILDSGEGLGQWDEKKYDWITYIQSGIYFTPDGVATKSKTRGINAKELEHGKVMDWLSTGATDPLLVSSRTFIGMGNPRSSYLYGQWQDSTKEVRIAGDKRRHLHHNCRACESGRSLADGLHTLTTNPAMGRTPSAPHPLPWIDGGIIHDDNPELQYPGDAIADIERRHA